MDQERTWDSMSFWPKESIRAICGDCGSVDGYLRRPESARICGVDVRNPLVYVCLKCESIVATPHITSGRIYAATMDLEKRISREMFLPIEAEDMAFAVHAALGLDPDDGEISRVVRMGLRLIGSRVSQEPKEEWKILDSFEPSMFAGLMLSEFHLKRIDGLRAEWGLELRDDVVRWLVVAVYHVSLRGFWLKEDGDDK